MHGAVDMYVQLFDDTRCTCICVSKLKKIIEEFILHSYFNNILRKKGCLRLINNFKVIIKQFVIEKNQNQKNLL